MECPSCRTEVPQGKRFCMECGAPMPSSCPSCGSLNPPNAKFCGDCGAKLASAGASTSLSPTPAPPTPAVPLSSAERRQLTVMFCDLVGSTALASRMDPEDLREIISAYHRCVAETVAHFKGFVAKYMGDGVLVYFGYPQAHEDDAERAVRAGLDLVEAVSSLKPWAATHLQCRIGLATGLVVVGDIIGTGDAQERGIVGETPNLAARLQAMAEPSSVVIAASTRRLLGSLFEYRDLGAVEAKGFDVPVQAWQALRPSAVESRFEALHSAVLTPLVGREEETELLLRRWARAKASAGQVVLLSGEPGIGKSRLTSALQDRLQSDLHTRVRHFCSPYRPDSAWYPVVSQLEHAAGFERHDTPETRLHKLEALLAATLPPAEDVALLAELLSLPVADCSPRLDLTPQRKKEKTFEALLRQLDLLARQRPVLIVYEDVHWIDPTSRELLDLTVERVRRLPVLLLVTFRPEFQPPWTGQPHVTTMTLTRLGQREGAELVERILGNQVLPGDIVEEIVERTDGIPLFLEELTKAVLETGAGEGDPEAPTSTAPRPALAIPATLHASLMARLDRLGPAAKETAQIGAAVGREFSYELLSAVAQRSEVELRSSLDQLVGAGLIFQRGTPPQASYVFKHALVQDAAYGTLLRGRRQELHARIAAVLEKEFPEQVAAAPELRAHHYTQAGLVEPAVENWSKAGQLAFARSATAEAVTQLTKALNLLATLPDSLARRRQELDLQVALGGTLMAAKGIAAPETGHAYARARELCAEIGDTPQLFPVLFGQSIVKNLRAEHTEALEVAEELLRLARRQEDFLPVVVAHHVLGGTLFHLGRFSPAREHLEQVLALYDPAQHRSFAFVWAQDPRVAGLSFLSRTLCALGYPDQALVRSRETLAEARALGHLVTVAYALMWDSVLSQLRRDRQAAHTGTEELISLATEQGYPPWMAGAMILDGWAQAAA